ncbi:glutamate-5-semialdehyde dehydrogenase [bacterium]|nr:glutamate-5-semialdehyde dehydrogenase [bacterium]MCG2676818.1 glutamate-5-semialdehyde dehydrogenase [bacterium]
MDIKNEMISMAKRAKRASKELAGLSTSAKNSILRNMARGLSKGKKGILKANERDVELAKKKGLSRALIDRLTLTPSRIENMTKSLREVASLPDPVGRIMKTTRRPNGLVIKKVRVPIGVIAMIYEARPNVTVEASALALKSGNAVILKGGSEAQSSNLAIVKILEETKGLPEDAIQLIKTTSRQAVRELLRLDDYIDLVIPRGGEGLIRTVRRESTIPVIAHAKGLCHIYVDRDADLNMAEEIVYNAKVQRPGVCNALETLLVHKSIARRFLPRMIERLEGAGVEVRGCPKTKRIAPGINEAREIDWQTEYLDLILSIKIVNSLEETLDHISRYGSNHSEAIITENKKTAERFLKEVDASAVFVNASTRLHDGGEFGLGAEIGISTQKLHARGPMGLEELTTYKYLVYGDGQVRE